MKILLASNSPRRYELLDSHGFEPVVFPPSVDESLPPGIDDTDPESAVKYLSLMKARDVVSRLADSNPGGVGIATDPRLLLAADTVVFCDRIIGKPANERAAFDILASYRLRTHEVWTGVTLIDRISGDEDTFAVCTKVTVGDYADDEIWRYIREEKPFDKAGAYAIQSDWKRHITSVDGDYENVIGLPWFPLKEHMERMIENGKKHELSGHRLADSRK